MQSDVMLVRRKGNINRTVSVLQYCLPLQWCTMVPGVPTGRSKFSHFPVVLQVMEKIGRNEIHDTKINREDPDWFLIYNYVASLLKAEELPELGQIGAVPRLLYSYDDCHIGQLQISCRMSKVLCPLFDKIEILIPADSPSILPSLDKM